MPDQDVLLATKRIVGDLVVTLDTVKKHATHLLGELGAANRAEAMARARSSGSFPDGPRSAGP